MKNENQYTEQQQENESGDVTHVTDNNEENRDIQGEFKITVRKLKIPVRPRGVLAE